MTRHMKQQHRKDLRERTLEAVQSLGFFSGGYEIHLEIGTPDLCVQRKRSHPGAAKHVYLRLGIEWLSTVFEPGLAVMRSLWSPRVLCYSVKKWAMAGQWGDHCVYSASAFRLVGNKTHDDSGYAVCFAGDWWIGDTVHTAWELAIKPYREALFGPDLPF